MIVLVLGGGGMLGHKLVQVLSPSMDVFATLHHTSEPYRQYRLLDPQRTFENVDIRDIASLETILDRVRPDVVVNAVGLIKQMVGPSDIVSALTINAIFPHRLAEVAARYGTRVISISTDCVFDGSKGNYAENDPPTATDLYGVSKRFGEVGGQNCLTIRTSMVGRELTGKRSLLEWFLSMRGQKVKGYTNAIFSGLPTIVLSELIGSIINDHQELSGVVHVSSEPISKFDLLTLFNEAFRADVCIERSDEVRIDRSLDSGRFKKATGIDLQPMPQLVARIASDTTPYDIF